MKKLLLISFSLLLLAGCKGNDPEIPAPWRIKAGKAFNLNIGQTATLNESGFSMIFIAVTEDSRCPDLANCIWAGQVTVKIFAQKGSVSDTLLLSNPVIDGFGKPNPAIFEGQTIRLLDVTPYPTLNATAKKAYEASFEVN